MKTLAEMSYAELKEQAAGRGLKYVAIKADVLRASIEEYDRVNAPANNPAKDEVPTSTAVTPEHADIAEEDISTSEKIRKLTAAGVSRKDIATLLGVRYQFVRNVQVRDNSKSGA